MAQLDFFSDLAGSKAIYTDLYDYIPALFSREESEHFAQKFIEDVAWDQRAVLMYGKEVITPRLTAWFGDVGSRDKASGLRVDPAPWTPELQLIRDRVEAEAGIRFNSVLFNYYRDGNDSVSWHDDMDRIPGKNKFVASVSFGQERSFDVRNKQDHSNKFSILLEKGSYLLMKGDFQHDWQHRIAKSTKPMKSRINLTFRIAV